MSCTLIITTYNSRSSLELVILSSLKQTLPPLEIIIADDGSKKDTKKLIEAFKEQSSIPIIHSYHEDKGFRVSKARNQAISMANGDYIVLVDGDMILHKDFIYDHYSFSKPGFFVQGIRAKLSSEKAKEVLKLKKIDFNYFENGIKNKRNSVRSSILSFIFSGTKLLNRLKMLQTCNMAFFKKDCIKVNGFNEDFVGWGREDSEFGARLLNIGCKRRDLKFKAIGYHIHHEGVSREMLDKNNKIFLNTIHKKLDWCSNGIDKFLNKT
jgi:GT2 family glycosyltransferase